jgi:hypothetical protein
VKQEICIIIAKFRNIFAVIIWISCSDNLFPGRILFQEPEGTTRCAIWGILRWGINSVVWFNDKMHSKKSHLALSNLVKLVFWSILSFQNWNVNTWNCISFHCTGDRFFWGKGRKYLTQIPGLKIVKYIYYKPGDRPHVYGKELKNWLVKYGLQKRPWVFRLT